MKILIREDIFGPYIRVGGYLFRPVPADANNGPLSLKAPDGERVLVYVVATRHIVGTKVSARHVGGTPYAIVGDEVWASHGVSARWDAESQRSLWIESTECYRG